MLIDINKIIVNDRIRKDYGDLEELAEDIRENTLLNALVVSPNEDGTYTLIAGERRLRAMRDILGYTQVIVNTVGARDDEHALLMEISENECRKEFTKTERLDYARRLARIEAAKAQERMLAGKAQDPMANLPQGTTREIVASRLDTSATQLRQEQYIEDHRDLLDPADFAEWDEGKLSTNKAYQRIKAAQKQAEAERDAAMSDAEMTSMLYGQAKTQLAETQGDLESAKEELANERGKNIELGSQMESLKRQLEEHPEPEVIEREVVREVVPDEVQERIEWLEHLEKIHSDDDQKLRRQLEETRKKLDRAKVLLEEKGYEDNASWDISTFTSAINQLLRTYGGKVWAFDQFYRVDEVTQQEFVKAVTSLAAFSQNIVQYVSDNKLEA